MRAGFVVVLFISCVLVCCVKCDLMGDLFSKMMGIHDIPLGGAGGTDCAACTIMVSLVGQLAQLNNGSVDKVLDDICSFFPTEIKAACDGLVLLYGSTIIKLLEARFTPDEVCLSVDKCNNNTCHLFPKRKSGFTPARVHLPSFSELFPKLKFSWPWDQVINHLPAEDLDGDTFSLMETLRGAHWRGKDCDDALKDVYPGRFRTIYDATVDHNCNGIKGIDPKTQQSYEDLFCAPTKQYGYIVLGDSAAAHFHIPAQWMTATQFNRAAFADMLPILEDELDWPEQSSGTGYMNETWAGHPDGPVDSIYQKMRQRNLCMHRDYQNIAVNGARAGAMLSDIVTTMARNQLADAPALVVYALIGNDVCNGHFGTSHMTTPQQFYPAVLGALKYLDTKLPAGSHVVIMGIVDGRVLYDAMATRIHPLGELNQDVTYADVYDYLNCLQISPCFGWMNTDSYWRNATTQRAFELNAVYKQIIANNTFRNFEVTYFDQPFIDALNMWVKSGGEIYQLIEPIDGFHPNQMANVLLTEVLWSQWQQNYTYLLNPINPNNTLINKIFGTQGGY